MNWHIRELTLTKLGWRQGQGSIFCSITWIEKIKWFVETCKDCCISTNKETREPVKPHAVTKQCCQKFAVDLFWPMPSTKHVAVVQNLKPTFPAAKIVSSQYR